MSCGREDTRSLYGGRRQKLDQIHVIELSGPVDRQGQQLPTGLGVITCVIEEVAGGWHIIAVQNAAVAA